MRKITSLILLLCALFISSLTCKEEYSNINPKRFLTSPTVTVRNHIKFCYESEKNKQDLDACIERARNMFCGFGQLQKKCKDTEECCRGHCVNKNSCK